MSPADIEETDVRATLLGHHAAVEQAAPVYPRAAALGAADRPRFGSLSVRLCMLIAVLMLVALLLGALLGRASVSIPPTSPGLLTQAESSAVAAATGAADMPQHSDGTAIPRPAPVEPAAALPHTGTNITSALSSPTTVETLVSPPSRLEPAAASASAASSASLPASDYESDLRIFVYSVDAFFASPIGRVLPSFYHTDSCRWSHLHNGARWWSSMYSMEAAITFKLLRLQAAPDAFRIPLQVPMRSREAFEALVAAAAAGSPLPPPLPDVDWLRVRVTSDPLEADFFFIPSVPSCYAQRHIEGDWRGRQAVGREYLLPLFRHIREDYPHWNRTGGGHRHLLVSATDGGLNSFLPDGRCALSNVSVLSNLGISAEADLPEPWGDRGRTPRCTTKPGVDIPLPQPILPLPGLWSELDDNARLIIGDDAVSEHTRKLLSATRSSTAELEPRWSDTPLRPDSSIFVTPHKNLTLRSMRGRRALTGVDRSFPSPSPSLSLFSHLPIDELPWLHQSARLARLNLTFSPVSDVRPLSRRSPLLTARPTLAYFRGTVSPLYGYSGGIRPLLLNLSRSEQMQLDLAARSLQSSNVTLPAPAPAPALQLAVYSGHTPPVRYASELRSSRFGIMAAGWAPWTPRLYDSLCLETVPLIIADGIAVAWEEMLDWRSFACKINRDSVPNITRTLTHISDEQSTRKQSNAYAVAPYFNWWGSDLDNAFSMLMRQLVCRLLLRGRRSPPPHSQPLYESAAEAQQAQAAGQRWSRDPIRSDLHLTRITMRARSRRAQLCRDYKPIGPDEF